MNILKIFTLSALTLMLMGLASCGRKGELLDSVPADCRMTALVNVRELCAEAGVKFTARGSEYAPALQGKMDDANAALDLMARLDAESVADMECVAVVVDPQGNPFIIFPISSFDAFSKACGERIDWADDAEGMHVGSVSNLSVVATDSQVWLTDVTPKAVDNVKALRESASKDPVSKVTGIAQMLSAKALVNIAVPEGKADKDADPMTQVWNTATITAPEGKLAVEWTRMQGDGEKQPLKGLQPVNPAVLAYVPSDPAVAAGVGLTPDFDWSVLNKLGGFIYDFQTQAMLSMAMPYLMSVDGTVMAAVTPLDEAAAAGGFNPATWRFILMAHMPQQKVNELLNTVRTMCFSAGISADVDPRTGIITVSQFGLNLYVGSVDGYFAVSNAPFSDTGNNSLAPLFEGKNGAARVRLESLKAYGPGLPSYGLDADVQVGEDGGRFMLTLPGSEGSVLTNLLTILL